MAQGNQAPKITVVSGFLGAGKTTLIKDMLHKGFLGKNPMLLENDLGALGIDGPMMESLGLQVTQLVSGCICCSLATEFPGALKELLEMEGCDQVVIEPSGIGQLSDVLKIIGRVDAQWEPGLVVSVVDADLFWEYAEDFPAVYWDQINNADVLVFTFVEDISDDDLQKVIDKIYETDPNKVVISASEGADVVASLKGVPCAALESFAAQAKGQEHHPHHGGDFDSFSKVIEGAVDVDAVKAALESLGDSEKFGNVLRAKGLLQIEGGIANVNYVPGRVRIDMMDPEAAKELEADQIGRMFAIGVGISEEALDRAFSF